MEQMIFTSFQLMFAMFPRDKTFIWDFLKKNNLEYYIQDASSEFKEYLKHITPLQINQAYFEKDENELLQMVGIPLHSFFDLKSIHSKVMQYLVNNHKSYIVNYQIEVNYRIILCHGFTNSIFSDVVFLLF